MKKRLLKRFSAGFRVAVVVASLLALGISGADAAARLYYGVGVEQTPEIEVVERSQIVPGPPSPEETADEMATGSRPHTEQDARLTSQAVFSNAKNEKRLSSQEAHSGTVTVTGWSDRASHDPVGSTCIVSSRLGRQFTLVGAKPSGTG